MDFTGKAIPDPGFSGDDGTADPALTAALAAQDDTAVFTALRTARLLVPVVALLGEVEVDENGLKHDKSSDMAVPTLNAPGGRRALPAFTSIEALAAWRPDARPVPVRSMQAAQATFSEDADTLLLDLAGPHPYEITGPRLRALAENRAHVPAHEDPDVALAVRTAVVAEPLVSAAYLAPGERGDVVLTLASAAPQAEVVAAAQRIAGRLAADDTVRGRLDAGLDLALLPPGAPEPGPAVFSRGQL